MHILQKFNDSRFTKVQQKYCKRTQSIIIIIWELHQLDLRGQDLLGFNLQINWYVQIKAQNQTL